MNCPKCGTPVPGSFCPSCGTPVTAPQQPQAAASQVPPPLPNGQVSFPQQPYGAPVQQPYGAPAQQPYGAPGQQPYGAPVQQPYAAPTQQPYGAPGYYPAPQKKGGGIGKVLLIIVGVIVGLFVLLLVIGSLLPDEETTPSGTNTTPTQSSKSTTAKGIVKGPIITDKVDESSQEPLTAMKATLPQNTGEIYAAVQIDLKSGQKLSARWYYAGKLQEQLNTNLDIPKDFKGWASFNIGNDGKPWPKGQYRVEVLVDGTKAAETSFSVQ